MNERVYEKSNPAFELPTQPEGWESKLEKSVEGQQGQDNPSATKTAHSSTQMMPPLSIPASATPIIQQNDNAGTTRSDFTNQASQHSDKIEKHWVERAKEVIARTKDNPHDQKKQISQVKADYLRTQFNKLIKTEETTG